MDRYDEKAAELLPCDCYSPLSSHYRFCQIYLRPFFAQALRDEAKRVGEKCANLLEIQAHEISTVSYGAGKLPEYHGAIILLQKGAGLIRTAMEQELTLR